MHMKGKILGKAQQQNRKQKSGWHRKFHSPDATCNYI